MTRFRFTRPVSAATVACALLAAGTSAAEAGASPVQTFMTVTITPAHPKGVPAAMATKYCATKGFTRAEAHIFVGFEASNGTVSALFRQITCVKYQLRTLERLDERAGDLNL